MQKEPDKAENIVQDKDKQSVVKGKKSNDSVEEIGGFDGPEPTRYGDWEKKGRCIDF